MMIRAPKMAEVESMKAERSALYDEQFAALEGETDIAEYNKKAVDFNRRWVTAGGDVGSGVKTLRDDDPTARKNREDFIRRTV